MFRWLILALAPVLLVSADRGAHRFEARGTLPTWSLRVAHNALEYAGYADKTLKADIEKMERSPGRILLSATLHFDDLHPIGTGRNGKMIYTVDGREETMSVEVVERACVDTKRRAFPTHVVITLSESDSRQGCGGSLASLEAALVPKP